MAPLFFVRILSKPTLAERSPKKLPPTLKYIDKLPAQRLLHPPFWSEDSVFLSR